MVYEHVRKLNDRLTELQPPKIQPRSILHFLLSSRTSNTDRERSTMWK